MPGRRKLRWNPARLTSIREAVGLSPESVAELVNKQLKGAKISGRKVRRWEAGTYVPDVKELEALCDVFHADVSIFFSAED